MEKLVIIGAGGYSKSVLDSVDKYNYQLIGFIDEFTDKKVHLGYPVIANSLEEIPENELKEMRFFIAIGNNRSREKWYKVLKARSLKIINVIDPSAIISEKAKLGTGVFVGKMAIINNQAVVGDDCIVNTKALIEHGCTVKNHVNLSTNSVINGDVVIDEGSFIGSCSVTLGQLKIGKWSTIGAGSVVTKNIKSNVTVAGVPAKFLKKGAMLG